MEQRIADIDFNALTAGRTFFPSPAAWEDEVLYFLMLDRFSDGRETGYRDNAGALVTTGTTPPFQSSDRGNATSTPTDRQRWVDAGNRFVGGTLRGLESKIGYLERLGHFRHLGQPDIQAGLVAGDVSTDTASRIFSTSIRVSARAQISSRSCNTAHQHGIRVILDVILNHTGDVFEYQSQQLRCNVFDEHGNVVRKEACWQADGTTYGVAGYRDATGNPTLPFGPVSATTFPTRPSGPPTCSRRKRSRARERFAIGTTSRSSAKATSNH